MSYKKSITYSPEDIHINNGIYDAFLNASLDDGWNYKDKIENFEYLVKIENYTGYPLKDSTILDVGCGTGDLWDFLQKYEFKNYTGIDIFHPALSKAKRKYPSGHFLLGDFLFHSFDSEFDYVFSSGAMTTNLESDNYRIIREWIPKMWSLAKKGVAFNFLMEQFEGHNFGNLYLYNADKVLEIIKEELPEAKIHTIITPAGAGDTLDEMHVYLLRRN